MQFKFKKRNDRKISLTYIFMLKPKQLFIIIYVNVCVNKGNNKITEQ